MNEWVRLQLQGDEWGTAGESLDLLSELWEPWRDLAACRGLDPNLFFPDRGESSREAKEVCASCPVRQQCMDYAERMHLHFGIWGGRAERERRRIRRARRLAA